VEKLAVLAKSGVVGGEAAFLFLNDKSNGSTVMPLSRWI
jgi:hypothetical protein